MSARLIWKSSLYAEVITSCIKCTFPEKGENILAIHNHNLTIDDIDPKLVFLRVLTNADWTFLFFLLHNADANLAKNNMYRLLEYLASLASELKGLPLVRTFHLFLSLTLIFFIDYILELHFMKLTIALSTFVGSYKMCKTGRSCEFFVRE